MHYRLRRKSGQWDQIFWSEILSALIETDRGDYQNAIDAIRAARSSASEATAPYFVAKASLDLAGVLIDVGGWQEALTLITESLPAFKQYGDKSSQEAAYVTLMDVYGGRESDLKDFDKAMESYSQAQGSSRPKRSFERRLAILWRFLKSTFSKGSTLRPSRT